jgi:hypothetical protein
VTSVPLFALNGDTELSADCAPTRSVNLDMRIVSRSSLQHVQPAAEHCEVLLKFVVFPKMSMKHPVGNKSLSWYPRMRNRAIGK